jgi:hypothetical protein
LAATNRPTSLKRIGSDGKALQSSLSGDDFAGADFDCGCGMKHTLHKTTSCATFETRRKRMAEDRCCRKDLVL